MELPENSARLHASRPTYVLRAWLIAVVPSLLNFLARVFMGAAALNPPASTVDVRSPGCSILAAPLLETALMYPLATLLAQMIPRQERIRIVLVAAIFALAHGLGGGWQQVIASFWPFLICSATLTAWRKHSGRDAFAVTALVHALYNATFFSMGAVGALIQAPQV